MHTSSQFVSKDFLKARSPEGLRALMLRNNLVLGSEVKYDIIFDGKNWYAWFYRDFRDALSRELNGVR